MTVPAVETREATKRFDRDLAVDGVSFTLQPGEILSVLGPSGCGKTTMLRIIAGFERVDGGEIRIQGRLASSPSQHEPPERRNVGMVFQDYALFPHLTVSRNIAFGLGKMTARERQLRLAEVLDLVSLTGLEDRYPHELSGGQQQRVALARTLAPRPVVVLLDEPFSNLDATMRIDVRRDVEIILRENRITTVFVTHDREEAFAMADRVAIMRSGRLDQIDTPEVLFHTPATPFVARMSGPCDFLSGEIGGDRALTELGELPWKANGDPFPVGTKVTLLVHMDDFQVLPDSEGQSAIVSREFRGDGIIAAVRLPSGATLRCRLHHFSPLSPGDTVALIPTRTAAFTAFERPDDVADVDTGSR